MSTTHDAPGTGEPAGGEGEPAVLDAERVIKALRLMPPDQLVEPGVRAGDALEVMTVPPPPPGCVHLPEQVYGTAGAGGRPLTMHLYAAADPTERRPGIVFIHGGGFQEGFPEMLIRYANRFAARGHVTASIRYRLSGEASFPAAVEDAKCAVRWMRANAASIGLDPGRIGVAGNSAGGHLAAMVANTPGRFEGGGGSHEASSSVKAAALLYPAVDLRPSAWTAAVKEVTAKLLGAAEVTEAAAAEASPVTYAAGAPPTLSFIGDSDPLITVGSLRAYHDALDAAGVENDLVVEAGAGHSYDYALARWEECDARMADWFGRHL
jgi:acetyl esterase